MLRRSVSILVVLVCASVVYAGANKIRGFMPVGDENPDADGFAILNYVASENKIIIQIILTDFTPNETYDIHIVDLDFYDANGDLRKTFIQDMLTTDDKGHATYHDSFTPPVDFSGSDLDLYLNGDKADEELRAYGMQ